MMNEPADVLVVEGGSGVQVLLLLLLALLLLLLLLLLLQISIVVYVMQIYYNRVCCVTSAVENTVPKCGIVPLSVL